MTNNRWTLTLTLMRTMVLFVVGPSYGQTTPPER
jgi:hypothetical protein